MSVLRLAALWALPLVLIPILIHLVYRRKHPTVDWPAMMFVRAAVRSGRGPAKWRRRAILALRTLVVLAVVLALARPLSSGIFGVAASRWASNAVSVIVLDRSPSMQRRLADGRTRQVAALESIATTLQTVGSRSIVLFDSGADAVVPLDDPEQLLTQPLRETADVSTDLPTLLLDALTYLQQHDHGVADVWVVSDRQSHDWDPDSSRWDTIDDRSRQLGDGCRFYLTDFPGDDSENHSVQVFQTRRQSSPKSGRLSLSVRINSDAKGDQTIPVAIRSAGITQSLKVEVADGVGERRDLEIEIPDGNRRVFGEVSIPADVNTSDDRWFFASQAGRGRPIALISQDESVALQAVVDVLGKRLDAAPQPDAAGQGRGVAGWTDMLQQSACVIWQGELPEGRDADELIRFVDGGGSVGFFPPAQPGSGHSFLGIRWGERVEPGNYKASFDGWDFDVRSYCEIDGELVGVAVVEGNSRLIGTTRHGAGVVFFCGADVVDPESLFVGDGVALFGMVSETLAASNRLTSDALRLTARRLGAEESIPGLDARDVVPLVRDDSQEQMPIRWGAQAGVFSTSDDPLSDAPLVVINRDPNESLSLMIDDERLSRMAPSLRWNRVAVQPDAGDSRTGFVREIWGAVWSVMIVAMLAEAWLSLPRRASGAAR